MKQSLGVVEALRLRGPEEGADACARTEACTLRRDFRDAQGVALEVGWADELVELLEVGRMSGRTHSRARTETFYEASAARTCNAKSPLRGVRHLERRGVERG